MFKLPLNPVIQSKEGIRYKAEWKRSAELVSIRLFEELEKEAVKI